MPLLLSTPLPQNMVEQIKATTGLQPLTGLRDARPYSPRNVRDDECRDVGAPDRKHFGNDTGDLGEFDSWIVWREGPTRTASAKPSKIPVNPLPSGLQTVPIYPGFRQRSILRE